MNARTQVLLVMIAMVMIIVVSCSLQINEKISFIKQIYLDILLVFL